MKRLLLTAMLLFAGLFTAKAQNDTIIYDVTQVGYNSNIILCDKQYDRLLLYVPEGYSSFHWTVNGENSYDNPLVLDSQTNSAFLVEGRPFNFKCWVYFIHIDLPETMVATVWKHKDESIEISLDTLPEPNFGTYSFLWSNGDTSPSIQVHECGAYYCNITHHVGSTTSCFDGTYTFIVQDNVEIDLATCDLESNLNMVTWDVTEAQAEYIDHLKVKRDGMEVGTANYIDGYYIDNIGSGAASRTYTITAVTKDGEDCPIVSDPKETIHMSYTLGVNGTIEVGWNTPTGYDLLGYNICEWTPGKSLPFGGAGERSETEGLRVIDFVGAGVTSYTCQASQFDNGYVVIQGVENGKQESRLLSNHSSEMVGVGEHETEGFRVYPNPTNGVFTIEGTGRLTIMNLLGQEILTQEIEGKTTLALPKGIYFMRLGSAIRKIVVE